MRFLQDRECRSGDRSYFNRSRCVAKRDAHAARLFDRLTTSSTIPTGLTGLCSSRVVAMADKSDTLFGRFSAGDPQAALEMLPLLYDELRAIAGRQFQGQRRDHTLQPTALLHEAFFRLVGRNPDGWVDRRHFFSVAATAMRQILVNHARDRAAEKRGGSGPRRVLLESGVIDGAA